MRERHTYSPLQTGSVRITALDTRPNPDKYYDYGYGYWHWTQSAEYIVDDPRSRWMDYRKGVRRRVMKNVYHENSLALVNESPITVQADQYWSWVGNPCARLAQYYGDIDLRDWAMDIVKAKLPAADTGHYDRWQATKPAMTSRLNLAVSLAELKDISRLWQGLCRKYKLWQRGDWKTMLSAKNLNSYHLEYNFGWKPLVTDVINVVRQYVDFDRRFRKLLNGADRDLMKRFRDQPASISKIWEIAAPAGFSPERIRFTLSADVKHTSIFHYAYSLPKYGQDELLARAWLDALGLNPSAATAYELITLSFVVDWFFNLGGLLESQASDWIEPWVTWHQACYSQSVENGSMRVEVLFSTSSGLQPYRALDVIFSLYKRRTGLPQFSMETDPLDADKIRLGASLIYGRIA